MRHLKKHTSQTQVLLIHHFLQNANEKLWYNLVYFCRKLVLS